MVTITLPSTLISAIRGEDVDELTNIVNSLHQQPDRFHFNFLNLIDNLAKYSPHSKTLWHWCELLSPATRGIIHGRNPNHCLGQHYHAKQAMAQGHFWALVFFLKQEHSTIETNLYLRLSADDCVRYADFFANSNLLYFFFGHVTQNKPQQILQHVGSAEILNILWDYGLRLRLSVNLFLHVFCTTSTHLSP
jgi:hypothetical protein